MTPGRHLRADARRNHERVLAAAADVFAERGSSASVNDIARRAGVGPATLFRHFATKRDLLLAVVTEKLEALLAEGRAAAADDDPASGLRRFFVTACAVTGRDQVVLELAHETITDPRLTELQTAMFGVMAALAERGRAAGVLRDDIEGEDLAALMSGLAYATRGATDRDAHLRYIEVVLAGLRPEAGRP